MAHSEEVLYDDRDLWWNRDYIELLSKRWNLKDKRSILDVGVGLGHWSRLLLEHCQFPFNFCGVDIEDKWLNEAPDYYYSNFPSSEKDAFNFIKADAHSLPIPDDTFEVTTCQTVLMHLKNPAKALNEMVRVTKPGGLIICVEPINLLNRLEFSNITYNVPIPLNSQIFKFWSYFHLGKMLNDEGDNDIGRNLYGIFEDAGLADIQSYQNEKTIPVYLKNEEREEITSISEKEIEIAKKGGCSDEEVKNAVDALNKLNNVLNSSFKTLYYRTGGQNMFIVSGRKPKV